MSFLLTSNFDGRSRLAQAVLAALQDRVGDGSDQGWDSKTSYDIMPFVNFWDLPKSKGYIVSVINTALSKQMNVGIFQMPNSDGIGIARYMSEIKPDIRATDFPNAESDYLDVEEYRYTGIYASAENAYHQLLSFTRLPI